MAFRLRKKEKFGDGIRRNVRRQIAKSLVLLRTGTDPVKVVRAVRRTLKRLRAVLRLVRDELHGTVYRRENRLFRDSARLLADVRDASVVVEMLDWLAEKARPPIKRRDYHRVRKVLTRNRKQVIRRVLTDQDAFAKVATAIEPMPGRLDEWTIRRDDQSAVARGLLRAYGAGHRALAAARAEPSVANLHEWRHQVQYFWHLLHLLERVGAGTEMPRSRQVHKLSRLLGECHDLALLRQALDADPLAFGERGITEGIFALIECRRKVVEQRAFDLGERIYQETPAVFLSRLEHSRPTPEDRPASQSC
jgi:hypothetical protein